MNDTEFKMERHPHKAFLLVVNRLRSTPPAHIYIDAAGLGESLAGELHHFIYNSLMNNRDYLSLSRVMALPSNTIGNSIWISFDSENSDITVNKYIENKGIYLNHSKTIHKNSSAVQGAFLKYEEIMRISSDNGVPNTLVIYTRSGTHETPGTLKDLLKVLPGTFLRIERREIINVDFLVHTEINLNAVFLGHDKLENPMRVEVGRQYKKEVKKRLFNGIFIPIKELKNT